MTLMGKFIFLRNAKEELIEKLKDPNTTYSDMTEIHKQMRHINMEIQQIKLMIHKEKQQRFTKPLYKQNYPTDI